MTTDQGNPGHAQPHAASAATVSNQINGPLNGDAIAIQTGSVEQLSVIKYAVGATPIDEQLRLLAAASWNQWTAAANDRRLRCPAPLPIRWRRSTELVAGPVSAALYSRFKPLPGVTAMDGAGPQEGDQDALHQIYAGLPSGRLLLIGPPGSGKSAAVILLLLEALRHREQAARHDQARIPVPVLFTLHGWDPDGGQSVTAWTVGKLAETYPMFYSRASRRAAANLLDAGRIAVFLDGLDEIPERVRPRVLAALADAPFRLVLLSRTAEAVDASGRGPLAGVVALELQPVKPADAAAYLLEPQLNPPPTRWKTITDHLAEVADHRRPAGALAQALTTPLVLSLLRDVYDPDDPDAPDEDLLSAARFPTAADIENHLLDKAVTAAYTPRPGHTAPRYTVATAQRTLGYLATRLTEQRTTDLAWWHIPVWMTHRSRMTTYTVVGVLLNLLIYGLALTPAFGPELGFLVGLVFGLTSLPSVVAALRWKAPIMPKRIGRFSCRSTARSLVPALISGLVGGLLAGLPAGLVFGPSAGLVSGLSVGLASGLTGFALNGFARHADIKVEASSSAPADVWRHDRNAGLAAALGQVLMVGLLALLTVRLVPGLAAAIASRPSVVLWVGLTVGSVWGLALTAMVHRTGTAMSSPGGAVIETAAATAQLAARHRTPPRLLAFLEDARSRQLLRTVGPVYQFRHAKLQDRLAQAPWTDRPTTRRPEGLTLTRPVE